MTVGGAVLFGFGLLLILCCLLLCLHACFVMYVRDESTQTQDNDINTSSNSERDSGSIPTYACINKNPPPSPPSTHNGRIAPRKFVTIGGNASQNINLSAKDRTIPRHGTPASENNGFKSEYSTYNAGRQQNYLQGPPVVQRLFAFSTDFSQPTPYSTLKQQHQKPSISQHHNHRNHIPRRKSGVRSGFEEKDYDNQTEFLPLMIDNQQSVQCNTLLEETFEPTPLVHPSARRPITFNLMSSSKTSIYDNVQCTIGLDTFKLDREND